MKSWPALDVEILKQFAPMGIKVLSANLPGRGLPAIYTKASKLGVRIAKVIPYDRNGDELTNKKWAWENRILPVLNRAEGGCMEWTGANSRGYGQIRLFADGVDRIYTTHRIALEVRLGRLLGSLAALHRCDNPRCNNPQHLFAGTPMDNVTDMHSKGRARGMFVPGQQAHDNLPRGEACVNATMTDVIVKELRVLQDSGLIGNKLLAKMYSLDKGIVRRATLRKGWKHVAEATDTERDLILRRFMIGRAVKPKRTGSVLPDYVIRIASTLPAL